MRTCGRPAAPHIANHLSLLHAIAHAQVFRVLAQVQVRRRIGAVVPYLHCVPAAAFVAFLHHRAVAYRHHGCARGRRIIYARMRPHNLIYRVLARVGEAAGDTLVVQRRFQKRLAQAVTLLVEIAANILVLIPIRFLPTPSVVEMRGVDTAYAYTSAVHELLLIIHAHRVPLLQTEEVYRPCVYLAQFQRQIHGKVVLHHRVPQAALYRRLRPPLHQLNRLLEVLHMQRVRQVQHLRGTNIGLIQPIAEHAIGLI